MTNRNRFRAGLFFGVVMTIFYIVGDFLTKDNSSSKEIFKTIIASLIRGAFGGLIFGWLIGKFSSSKFVSDTTKINIDKDEQLIFETPANHFKGIEGVGGKLYLTDKRLVFKSHKLNIQNHELAINHSDITQVDKYKTLGLVNNGLSVQTVYQQTEKFVVEKVDEWLLNFDKTKNGLQQGQRG